MLMPARIRKRCSGRARVAQTGAFARVIYRARFRGERAREGRRERESRDDTTFRRLPGVDYLPLALRVSRARNVTEKRVLFFFFVPLLRAQFVRLRGRARFELPQFGRCFSDRGPMISIFVTRADPCARIPKIRLEITSYRALSQFCSERGGGALARDIRLLRGEECRSDARRKSARSGPPTWHAKDVDDVARTSSYFLRATGSFRYVPTNVNRTSRLRGVRSSPRVLFRQLDP